MLEQALTVAAAKAKVLGLIVAAAAIGGTTAVSVAGSASFLPAADSTIAATASPDPSATPVALGDPQASPDPSESPDPSDSPDPSALPAPSSVATPTSTCPAGMSHGQYVSSVAHDRSATGREHGKAVSEAAHSDCGKGGADSADGSSAGVDPEAHESSEAPKTANQKVAKQHAKLVKKTGRHHH